MVVDNIGGREEKVLIKSNSKKIAIIASETQKKDAKIHHDIIESLLQIVF